MGNKNATLGLKLDQSALQAGSTVTGCVFLQVKKDISAESLQITFTGQEYSHVHWTTQRTRNKRTETVHHHAYQTRRLVHMDMPLATFPQGKILPGRYEYPFSAPLPDSLPSTMYARGGGGDCNINYFFRTRLHRRGWTKCDIKSKTSVMVQAKPVLAQKIPAFLKPSTTRVKFCCCVNKGSMTLGATIDDTVVGRGQAISAVVAASNDSTTDVKSIRVRVHENVTWTAAGHWNNSFRYVGDTILRPDQVDGCSKVDKAAKSNQISPDMYKMLFTTLQQGVQRTSFAIAENARDSYFGACVWVKHTFCVKMITPYCITDPSVGIDVRVCPQMIQTHSPQVAVVDAVAVSAEAASINIAMPVAMVQDKEEKTSIKALPEDWKPDTVAETVTVPIATAARLGGTAVALELDAEINADEGELAEIPVAPTIEDEPLGVNWSILKKKMDESYDDFRLFKSLVKDEKRWIKFFANLDPDTFGLIVTEVNLEFEQANVAAFLADFLESDGAGLTCAHVAKAVDKKNQMSFRSQIVNRLALRCTDLQENASLIREQLDQWETIMCEDALKNA